jgi:hypothetical protein
MRVDLIPERDRFIPGWHNRPEPRRAEQSPPEWQWPRRPLGAVRAFLRNLLQVYRAAKSPSNPRHIEPAGPLNPLGGNHHATLPGLEPPIEG